MDYTLLYKQVISLIKDETDTIANLANISALINESMDRINWVGFYLYKGNELVLGPFQGKVACTRLKHGKGVCSAALEKNISLNVPDVHKFPGHIACDDASRSELVIPIYIKGKPYGVLDIDSPFINRFNESDIKGFEKLVSALIENH